MKRNNITKKLSEKLNFFTITKKYWKEQIFFYFLTTISFIGSWFISKNSLNFAYDIIKKKEFQRLSNLHYKLTWGKSIIHNFKEDIRSFLIVMALIIIVYCAVVIVHVYYCYWLNNKIIYDIKKQLLIKNFRLKNFSDKKQFLNTLIHDTRSFADWVIFAPNQIYYTLLSTFLTFWSVSQTPESAQGSVLLLGVFYFVIVLTITALFNFLLYKKDLNFQKRLEIQTQLENTLVNDRELIIKKGWEKEFFQNYKILLKNTRQTANKEDWIYTLNFVVPSYSLIEYANYVFYPLIKTPEGWIAFNHLTNLFKSLKTTVARIREYPYYLSAKKRINFLLNQKERDDIQKNIIITEPVEKITFKNVIFGYNSDKLVLKKFNLTFSRGKVNHLEGANGFGKSTIVNLLMGLYQPNQGEILINNKNKLTEINLQTWRKKIAYAEHQNLVKNGLSTGQKQLIDLENLFKDDKNKEIFIFDEADNSLDLINKNSFYQRLESLSQKGKIIILITH